MGKYYVETIIGSNQTGFKLLPKDKSFGRRKSIKTWEIGGRDV